MSQQHLCKNVLSEISRMTTEVKLARFCASCNMSVVSSIGTDYTYAHRNVNCQVCVLCLRFWKKNSTTTC